MLKTIFFFISISFFAGLQVLYQDIKVLAVENKCVDYNLIYLRGSGQKLKDNEETTYFKQINESLTAHTFNNISINNSVLGVTHNYLAVPVGASFDENRFANTLSAEVNWVADSINGNYPSSVKSGVDSLKDYFTYQRDNNVFDNCPNIRYVIGGYSQGAEVVGNFLPWLVENDMDKHVSFVALFGDPKYKSKNLFNPLEPTKTYSWYRGVIGDYTTFNGGVNDPRNPYIPEEFEGKVGSWCNANDGICNGNALQLVTDDRKEHGTYHTKAIPDAAKEIATALKNDWAKNGHYIRSNSCGTAKQDIVLVVDTSPSMRKTFGPFDEASASAIADNAFSQGCSVQVAIVSYGLPGSGQQTVQNFTGSKEVIKSTLIGLKDSSLPTEDDPTYDVSPTEAREGLIYAMDRTWRDNAAKAAIVISNMPGNGITPHYNSYVQKDLFKADPTTQRVIKSSYEKGGIEIYAYAQPTYYGVDTTPYRFSADMSYVDYYEILSTPTGGTYHASGCYSECTWSNLPFPKIGNKPQAAAKNIKTYVGDVTTLSALDISDGAIGQAEAMGRGMKYDWYLNCGDYTQLLYMGKEVNPIFTEPQSCTAALVTRANPSYCYYCNGRFASMSYSGSALATFTLEVLPAQEAKVQTAEIPNTITNLYQYIEPGKTTITWDPPAGADVDDIVYVIRDQSGSYLGAMQSNRLIINNLPKDNADITIEAFSQGGSSSRVNIDSAIKTEAPALNTTYSDVDTSLSAAPFLPLPTISPIVVESKNDPYKLSINNDLRAGSGTNSQSLQPLVLPDISDPAASVASIQSQSNTNKTDMPVWQLSLLILIFASAGIRLASITFLKK